MDVPVDETRPHPDALTGADFAPSTDDAAGWQRRAEDALDEAGRHMATILNLNASLDRLSRRAFRAEAERDAGRALLRGVELYLATIHRHAGQHDVLGADLTCAGCELLGRVERALAAADRAQAPREAGCSRRGAPQAAPASARQGDALREPQGPCGGSEPTDTEGDPR